MQEFDPMQEWQRLLDVYGAMDDTELERMAREAYQLTDVAREVLRSEISRRRLDVAVQQTLPTREPVKPGGTSPLTGKLLDDELGLGVLVTVLDPEEASRIEQALEQAGIAHFLGDEDVDNVSAVKDSFAGGVEIKVRHVDWHRAALVLRHLDETSGTELPSDDDQDNYGTGVRCPNCGCSEIVLEIVEPGTKGPGPLHSEYCWACHECEHQWRDDGMAEG